jgi:tetratricopeptide (TPR) repeat protein
MMFRIPMLFGAMFAAACPVAAQTSLFPTNYLRSPEFRDAFLGTFGVKSDIEPPLTETEAGYLEKIAPHLAAGEIDDCIDTFKKIATKEATARFDYELAMLYFSHKKDNASAEQWFLSAITKFPRFLRAHQNLGLLYTRLNQTQKAVPHITRSIALGQADEQLFGLLAFCHMQNGNPLSAETAYRSAIMLGPKTLDWKMGLARALFAQQKAPEAVALMDELLKEHPGRTDLWSLQAMALLANKQPLKAAENFEILALMGKATHENLNLLGDIYVNEAIYPLAANAYISALKANPPPTTPEAALKASEAFAQRAAYTQARQVLAALEQAFGKLDEESHVRMMTTRARIAMAEGSFDEGVKILKEIVNANPLDGGALMQLADYYNKKSSDDKEQMAADKVQAMFYWERALKVAAVEADASVRLAQALMAQSASDVDKAKRAEKLQRAIELIKRSQELKPRDSVGRYLADLERMLTKMRSA